MKVVLYFMFCAPVQILQYYRPYKPYKRKQRDMTNRVARRCLTRRNGKLRRVPYEMKKYRYVPNLEIFQFIPYKNYTF